MDPAYAEHESDLGAWRTCGWSPGPGDPLAAVLDSIWYFEGYTTLLRQRSFPNARYEIVVQFGAPHRPIEGERYDHPFPRVCVSGMVTGSQVIEAPRGRMCVMGIRFTPPGARAVLGVPLDRIAGLGTFDLADLIGAGASELEGRLHDLRDGPQRVTFAREWVRAAVACTAPAEAAIEHAFATIDRGETLRVGGVRERSGIDKTRYLNRFRETIGVTPKRFATIVRVRVGIEMLASGCGSLAAIAHAAGYYDQAHFTNEVHRLTGVTPRDYLAARNYPSSASVAEPGPSAENFPRPPAAERRMLEA